MKKIFNILLILLSLQGFGQANFGGGSGSTNVRYGITTPLVLGTDKKGDEYLRTSTGDNTALSSENYVFDGTQWNLRPTSPAVGDWLGIEQHSANNSTNLTTVTSSNSNNFGTLLTTASRVDLTGATVQGGMVVNATNGTITVSKSGTYNIVISVTIQSAGANGQWGQLVKNNATILNLNSGYSQVSSASMQIVFNYSGLFDAGDIIDVRLSASSAGTIGVMGYSYSVVQGSNYLPVTVIGNVFYKQCQVIDKLQSSTADEGDLILLNGRLKSTLTAAQQAVATACGYGTNLFDGVGKMLVGSGSGFTPLATGGSATSIIGQANLPNISLTSNAVSAGTPAGSIANTVTATYHSATGDGFNGGRIQLTDRAGFNVTNPSEMTVSSSFTGTALGTHQHTSSLGGSGTALSTQNPYGVVAKYVYLGVANPVVTASQALSLTTTGTGASTFDSGTGILNVPYQANTFNSLTNATATNTLDNTLNAQTWNWSSATTQTPLTISAPALTTGSALTVSPSPNTIGITNNGRQLVNVGTTSITTPLLVTGSINDYLEVKIKNSSTGIQAQSGFTAEADNGSATTGFAWWGINNSTFNFPTLYNAGVINDVTLVGSGQDLIIANANQTKAIKFQTGRATTPFFDNRMTILNSGNVGIGTITPTSTLQVTGSVSNNINNQAGASYTVLATDYHVRLSGAINQTVTLPSAVGVTGRIYIFSNPTGYLKAISSIRDLNQVATTIINSHECFAIQSDGTNWNKISSSNEKFDIQSKYFTSGAFTTGSLIVGGLEFSINSASVGISTFLQVRGVGTKATSDNYTIVVSRLSSGATLSGEILNPSIAGTYVAVQTATTAINGAYIDITYPISNRGTGEHYRVNITTNGSTNATMTVIYTRP
jgi:hypothetical protein